MENYLDQYDLDHAAKANVVLHILSIPLLYIGLMGLLWLLPDDLIKSWMGDLPFANWATVFAILMLVYYGSESFSMTFPTGGFLLGCLFLVNRISLFMPEYFQIIMAVTFISGIMLMLTGHLIEGNTRAMGNDFKYFMITPAWIFRFVFQKFDIPL
ncbi:MAG: DUF962 domain-containing protein [Cyclobacteriaceae bacterium]|nr:DUF962 domain-containing protein [Cyclobacteriaceae bacterium]